MISGSFAENDTEVGMFFFAQELENEPLPDVAQLDREVEIATREEKAATSGSDMRRWRERKEDLMRLKRVEQVYVR